MDYFLDIVRRSDIHSYKIRNNDTLRLSKVKRNWGKQRTNYKAINDRNNPDSELRNTNVQISNFQEKFVFKILT